jgi:ribulose-5-phosphate 4-epimerase/fuculose-1-phosphate aldolase
MTAHAAQREQLSRVGRSLFERGFTAGSSGNLSVRLDAGFLVTPTNSSLGQLDPLDMTHLSSDGQHLSGAAPSKEWFFHRACYEARASIGAVIHLHSTYAAAVSCLADLDCNNCLPPLTAYQVMKFGPVPRVDFFRPGDPALGLAVGSLIRRHTAVLLANHGPVVVGRTLEAALFAAEELEETAKLFLLLRGSQTRPLSDAQIEDVKRHFPPDPDLVEKTGQS